MENGKVFQEPSKIYDPNELNLEEDLKLVSLRSESPPRKYKVSLSFTEWGSYFNEGFSVNSVNNGILIRREILRDDCKDEVIQLSIENAKDFSFKNSDKKSFCDIQEDLKEDMFVRYHSCEDKAKNIDELFGESKLSVLDDKLLKSDDFQIKDDILDNLDNNEENKNNFNEEVTLNSVQLEYPDKKEEEKISDYSKEYEIREELITVNKNKELKLREFEIKNLNEKLNQQKFQNKIILDENKKLLEIINIFKILQNLEKPSNSKSTTSIPVEINEIEKDIKNYKSNKQNQSPKKIHNEDFSDFFDTNNIEQNSQINSLTINSPTKNNNKQDYKPEIADKNCKTYINTDRKKKTSYGDKYRQLSKKNKEMEAHFRQPRHEECHKQKEFIKTKKEDRRYTGNKNWNILLKSKDEEQDLKILNEKMRIQEFLPIKRIPNQCEESENIEYNSHDFQKINLLSSSYDKFINYNSENQNNKFADSTDFEPIVRKLEKYKEMNDKLMNCLSTENIFTKIDVEKRKKDVEKLNEILDYLDNLRMTQRRQEHMIPFYLVDRNKIYENIVNYINLKNKEKFKLPTRLRSPKKKIKNQN
jgi:hypothetical protein